MPLHCSACNSLKVLVLPESWSQADALLSKVCGPERKTWWFLHMLKTA
jgi:hypothetical protein